MINFFVFLLVVGLAFVLTLMWAGVFEKGGEE